MHRTFWTRGAAAGRPGGAQGGKQSVPFYPRMHLHNANARAGLPCHSVTHRDPDVMAGGRIVPAHSARRPPIDGWLRMPTACSPIGGGMIKLAGGPTWAALTVGAGPYVIYAMLYLPFMLGFFAAIARCLCSHADTRQAMERLITVSANAVIAILTLTQLQLPLSNDQQLTDGTRCRSHGPSASHH